MLLRQIAGSPVSWGIAGFAIGLALGVTYTSAWLVAGGLGAYILCLKLQGPSVRHTEGRLFATGPVFMMAWLIGFVVHGLAF